MQAERWIALEAVDRTRNLFRAWRCEIGTDLFGAVTISVTFGRIGTRGRTITRTAAGHGAADAALRSMLARRASANEARPSARGQSVEPWRMVSLRAKRGRIDHSRTNGACFLPFDSNVSATPRAVIARGFVGPGVPSVSVRGVAS